MNTLHIYNHRYLKPVSIFDQLVFWNFLIFQQVQHSSNNAASRFCSSNLPSGLEHFVQVSGQS
jgi:hypothetical protein